MGLQKNLGHSHLIPFLKLSARRCVHVPLYVNFTFVSFSWFLLLRHVPHPFYAIFHSPLPLKKRLRTQDLKPLTPPQRFKHCEQPWKVMHCQHDYLECLQSLLAPVLSWFFFPEFLWFCPVSLSAGGLVAPGSLFQIATIPFNIKTVNYCSNISDQLKTQHSNAWSIATHIICFWHCYL